MEGLRWLSLQVLVEHVLVGGFQVPREACAVKQGAVFAGLLHLVSQGVESLG